MRISFDTETDPFAPGLQFPPIVCGQFALSGRADDCAVLLADEALDTVAAILCDDNITVIGHTLPFDFGVCVAARPALLSAVFAKFDAGLVLGIDIRQKLLDIAAGTRSINAYSLEDLARRYGFGPLDKATAEQGGWRSRFAELRNVHPSQWPTRALEYARVDATICHPIFNAQDACDYGGVLDGEQQRQSAYAWWIKLMTGWGITTDANSVDAFARGLNEDYAEKAAYLRVEGLLRPDKVIKSGPRKGLVVPGSRDTKATKARMSQAIEGMTDEDLSKGGYVTATGNVSLNKKVLREVEDPALHAYADLSSLKKQISTDIPLLSHRVIHSFFDTLKETGRIGSSQPNITNLPTKVGVRECFVPRPGCCFVSADYGGIELFTWSEVCFALLGHSTLGEELKAGVDPHLQIAADILSATNPAATYAWCAANKKAVYLERQTGKVLNFGCPGGIGAGRLAFAAKNQYGVELSEERAKELRDLWWGKRTEMRAYSNYISRITDMGGVIEHLYSGRVRGGCTYTEACNSLFQGLASDIAKSAGIEVARACYVLTQSPLYGCRIVNFIHDEFVLEVPLGRQHEAALELSRIMRAACPRWLRHVPAPKVEVDAMMRWSKKVVALYVNGELVPWIRSVDGTHYGLVNGREEQVAA